MDSGLGHHHQRRGDLIQVVTVQVVPDENDHHPEEVTDHRHQVDDANTPRARMTEMTAVETETMMTDDDPEVHEMPTGIEAPTETTGEMTVATIETSVMTAMNAPMAMIEKV